MSARNRSASTPGKNLAWTDAVTAWLQWAGFRFDPFLPLDAAADPRLSEYLVGHDVFTRIWGDEISWVFAPAGGGKTALRIALSRACWIGQETNRPFPIPYTPPFLAWGHATPSLDDHLLALTRSGAIALFLALAYRPHWFFRLDDHQQREVRAVLQENLPGPLPFYLERCRQEGSVEGLRESLDPTMLLRDPPGRQTLLDWCDALEGETDGWSPSLSPEDRWHRLKDLLLGALRFPSIYVLADGLDGAPETAADAAAVADCLVPLMGCAEQWAQENVFLKGFLPEEAFAALAKEFPQTVTPARSMRVEWSPALLAEVIRRRVYVATEGAFGSLDAVASHALRDLETMLAKVVTPPVPREMLVLTRQVIETHTRNRGAEGLIEEEDLSIAINIYRMG